ncbi:MAG: hypothetical protein FD166_2743 [Bacteroidetes bacterium]|nr:MAG: hypothetical protein FD166_2743 [Bacteroidota bacterium]
MPDFSPPVKIKSEAQATHGIFFVLINKNISQ